VEAHGQLKLGPNVPRPGTKYKRSKIVFAVTSIAFTIVHICTELLQLLAQSLIGIPSTLLGCDQQNLENFLSDFKWAGHRLAHVFADGWSTASHKRKMTLMEAPTGTLLFCYKDIKQKIVQTLLLEEYGVSKKWVIIKDRKQDSNVASTPAKTSGPSAQDRWCASSS